MMRGKVFLTSNDGSFAWRMNTPTSDFDLKIVYVMDMDDLLAGKHFRNEEYKVRDPRTNDVRVDITYIEVGKFIGQLKECNTNTYVQLFSPMVRFPAAMKPFVDELRGIAMENFSRGIKHSLLGIIKNTIARGQQNQPKRRKLCLRLLRTVESAMATGKWTFDPVT